MIMTTELLHGAFASRNFSGPRRSCRPLFLLFSIWLISSGSESHQAVFVELAAHKPTLGQFLKRMKLELALRRGGKRMCSPCSTFTHLRI